LTTKDASSLSGRIIDFHVHLPLRDASGDVSRAVEVLLHEMDNAGVSTALVIAIEASPEILRRHVTPELLRSAVQPLAYDWKALTHPTLYSIMTDPEGVLRDQVKLYENHLAPSELVAEAVNASGGRLLGVASYCRLNSPEEYVERLERLRRDSLIVGVKVYPTLHFIKPDAPELEYVYDYLESEGLLLIVHTGCDPGIWELPALCTTANPRYLEPVARRHRDLTIIVAHMGSYSYLFPGIYFAEALRLARSHDNVYLDTSATTLHQVKIALSRVGVEKLLYGSDYPYFSGLHMSDIVEAYLEFRVPGWVKEAILHDNAARLLASLGLRLPSLGGAPG